MCSGYLQIPITPKDKKKFNIAFVTHQGIFQFKVMPFGLTNAPASFQSNMDSVLAGLKWKNLLFYLDDIIVCSETFDKNISKVFRYSERNINYGAYSLSSKFCLSFYCSNRCQWVCDYWFLSQCFDEQDKVVSYTSRILQDWKIKWCFREKKVWQLSGLEEFHTIWNWELLFWRNW